MPSATSPHASQNMTLNFGLEQPRYQQDPDDEDDSLTNAENDDYFQPHTRDSRATAGSPSHSTILGLRSDGTSGSPSPVRRTVLMSSPLSGIRNAALNVARGRSFDAGDRRVEDEASRGLDGVGFVHGGPGGSLDGGSSRGQMAQAQASVYPEDEAYEHDDKSLEAVPTYRATPAQVRQWIARQLHLKLGMEAGEARRRARGWRWLGGDGLREGTEAVFRDCLGSELGWWVWWEVQTRTGRHRAARGRRPLLSPGKSCYCCSTMALLRLVVGDDIANLGFSQTF